MLKVCCDSFSSLSLSLFIWFLLHAMQMELRQGRQWRRSDDLKEQREAKSLQRATAAAAQKGREGERERDGIEYKLTAMNEVME